jgi:N-carbamoyl-L-amino-acid hydrolase
MIFTRADRDFAESLFGHVARETRDPSGGVCRPSYGRGESIAWVLVAEAASDLGLHARSDDAGNLLLTHDSESIPPRATWIGSHLDSVPSGGNYDGLAGVVAALLLVAKAREKHCTLPLVGLGLRGEESAWFGVPYLGSKALLGKLHPLDLDRQRRAAGNEEGLLLRDYMELLSILWPRLVNENPLVTISQVAEFWELHIEQGPLLAARNKPVGVVTGIRGNVRAPRARVTGRADHSGTTPHDLRHDAVVRFAEIMTKLEVQRGALAALGDDLVFTSEPTPRSTQSRRSRTKSTSRSRHVAWTTRAPVTSWPTPGPWA